jgi:multidrug efflux pump subunit AcrA (membrane-fusion protein)
MNGGTLNIGLLLLLILSLAACRPNNTVATAVKPAEEPVVRLQKVRTVVAKGGALQANRTAGVTLAPVRESNVASGANGKVLRVLVEEGSSVKAGQAIVQLDNANSQSALEGADLGVKTARVNLERAQRSTEGSLAPLKSSLESALSNLEVARRRFVEGQQLAKVGAIARVELTSLEAAFNQAKAASDNARESLLRAQRAQSEDLALLRLQIEQAQNQLAQARRNLGDATIKAPFAGVVAEVYANPGEFVAAGGRAFRLADTSRLEAKFRIPPSEAAKLPIGSGMNLDYGGKTYFAKLGRTSQIPGTDRLVEAVATVSAPLTPGATANLRYTLKLAEGVIVPSGALLPGESTRVMLIQENKARAVGVQILGDNGTALALGGIPAGARVVFPVPANLRSGDSVEVIQ